MSLSVNLNFLKYYDFQVYDSNEEKARTFVLGV